MIFGVICELKIIKFVYSAKPLMMKRLTQPWMNWEFIFQRSQLYKDMWEKITELHEKIDEIIEYNEMKNNNNEGEPQTTYVIDQLLSKKYNLSHEEIRDEIYIFILAVSFSYIKVQYFQLSLNIYSLSGL